MKKNTVSCPESKIQVQLYQINLLQSILFHRVFVLYTFIIHTGHFVENMAASVTFKKKMASAVLPSTNANTTLLDSSTNNSIQEESTTTQAQKNKLQQDEEIPALQRLEQASQGSSDIQQLDLSTKTRKNTKLTDNEMIKVLLPNPFFPIFLFLNDIFS